MSLSNVDPDNAMPIWHAPNPVPATLTHLTAAASTLIKTGPGWITGVSVNTATTSGNLTIYDGVDATGKVLAVIDISKQWGGAIGNEFWPFATGLFVVQSATADITITSHART